jgi:hypothetical protein
MNPIANRTLSGESSNVATSVLTAFLVALAQCIIPILLLGEVTEEGSSLLSRLEGSTLPLGAYRVPDCRAVSGRVTPPDDTPTRLAASRGPALARPPPSSA